MKKMTFKELWKLRNKKIRKVLWERWKGNRQIELLQLENGSIFLRFTRWKEIYDQMYDTEIEGIVKVENTTPDFLVNIKNMDFEELWKRWCK